jgi:hypothetical protein
MSVLAMKHFDLLNFVKKSKELGVPEPLAEYQGRQLEEAIEIAIASNKREINEQELVPKKELKEMEVILRKDLKEIESRLELKIKEVELKIEQSKNHLVMWMVGLFIVSGLITHFLK